jgi:hypothetical protein
MARLLQVLFCAALLLAFSGCIVCQEEIVDQTTSSDRQWTTRTTVRTCGTMATTNVYLQRADGRARLGEIVLLVRRVHPLRITWSSPSQMQVTCDGCGEDVRVLRSNVHGVSIAMSR